MALKDADFSEFTHVSCGVNEHGIAIIRLLDASSLAVDELIECAIRLNLNADPTEIVFQLIDARIGLPSIRYAIDQARRQSNRYPPTHGFRVAIVYAKPQWMIVDVFIKLISSLRLPNLQVQLFDEKSYDKGINWLKLQVQKVASSAPRN